MIQVQTATDCNRLQQPATDSWRRLAFFLCCATVRGKGALAATHCNTLQHNVITMTMAAIALDKGAGSLATGLLSW